MRTRVKICGLTTVEQAGEAAALGVDAIGLVFAPESPRYVEPARALAIAEALPPFVTAVGLFMNAEVAMVDKVLEQVPLDLLQFHGDEAPDYCRAFGRPYLKAVPMGGGVDPLAYAAEFGDAKGFLLDGHAAGEPGGSGMAFDWTAMPRTLAKPVILAGGLTPDNVAEAIRRARPYGVDVSSGVESAKGIKDAAKMAAFMRGVTEGDSAD